MMNKWLLDPWLAVGFGGQALFASRFIVQWIVSEKAGRSTVPRIFWWLSLGGGTVLAIYAFHRKDPVFFLGQALGLLIYTRNLALSRRGE